MKENFQIEIMKLKQYVKMRTPEDIHAFDFKVWDLAKTQDQEVLSYLIDLFDDECECPGVMYSLVHAIESYPDNIYVEGILRKTHDNIWNYVGWFKRLLYGILNHPNCLGIFRSNIHLAKKETLLKLLDSISQESERHREICAELRELLEKAKP